MSNGLLLPPRSDGGRLSIDVDGGAVAVIGANGAGKSRFAAYMAAELGDGAVSLSALDAVRPEAFEAMMKRLMHDELLSLIDYKMRSAADPAARPRATRLDRVIGMWRQIFPANRILIETGEMLFSREADATGGSEPEAYVAGKLSAGERTVLYFLAAAAYAPRGARVFVDNSAMFLHPSVHTALWDLIEDSRHDCTFIYTTHDLDFVATRSHAATVWVRGYNPAAKTWDYDVLPADTGIGDDIYLAILGARKHVLFIEGDGVNSIDAKLYPLVFKDYTVKSLGSCNKVIEATRTFNDLRDFHHLDSRGIVDRDRRDEGEVKYLRDRKVFVPEVAEIENILMLEEVVRTVATDCHRDENKIFAKVSAAVIAQFEHELRGQALLHTRHRVKRTIECRVDGRFAGIGDLEEHLGGLVDEINPRGLYEQLCRRFRALVAQRDYAGVLKVYNRKSMLSSSNVGQLCGLGGKDRYLRRILDILRHDGDGATRIRRAITACFRLPE